MLSLTDERTYYQLRKNLLRNFRQIYFNHKIIYARASCANSQKIDKTISAMLQTSIDDIEKDFVCSPISKINWTSHVILLDSSLPLRKKILVHETVR